MYRMHGSNHTCDLCDKKCSSRNALRKHKKRIHPQTDFIQCVEDGFVKTEIKEEREDDSNDDFEEKAENIGEGKD